MTHLASCRSYSRPILCLVGLIALLLPATLRAGEPLAGTSPLELAIGREVIHARCYGQVHDYFQRRIEAAGELRRGEWNADFSSVEAYDKSLETHRVHLIEMLGLPEGTTAIGQAKRELLHQSDGCRIERVTVPMSLGRSARGLLFSPGDRAKHPAVIVCGDAGGWPERLAGLEADAQPPRWLTDLVARGAIVFVPNSVERLVDHPYCERLNNKDRRWILYRLGYPVGRTMPGLDVDDARAVVGHLGRWADVDQERIGLVGFGQGGMTALLTAAIDRRVAAAAVVDYFQERDRVWEEPVDRRLPGQLLEFGDAELAALVAPRRLAIVRSGDSPAAEHLASAEILRAARFYDGLKRLDRLTLESTLPGESPASRAAFRVGQALELPPEKEAPPWPAIEIPADDALALRNRHFEERLDYLRRLIDASEAKRLARWKLTSCPRSDFEEVKAAMLDDYRQLVGEVSTTGTPVNARSELVLSTDRYQAYRVMLDVTDGVEVYGNLLVPRAIEGRAAAVICQHGLNGTPEMLTGLRMSADTPYHEFGRQLAEKGYVVFAPYLLHRTTPDVNVLVRQADAVGMMRVAMPVAKTQRVIDFLETLPFVDPERIGYYGLSYGGYSAIWISPLVERLKAVVVSGHFNDWRSKITNDTLRTSYLWHPDEDFYNWNILHRFTHPELIAMTAPRAVCVEFAERDGITTPEWTEYAWAQVLAWRDRLGLTDRVVMARFDGVHEVRAVESVEFLDRFLRP
jgi:dienelactone hydrolase